ncbi:MAG: ATP-binding cassette domain-containing protein [Cellulosilyticaceae bacterium]
MIMIETKGLCFDYPDGTKALDEVNLTIQKGKTTALLGGNGAGKSTLFLTLNGLLKPTGGKMYYKGNLISYKKKELKALREWVGIVFQDPDRQLFSASVYEDVSFGVVNQGIEETLARQRIEEALKQTGMWELRHKPTHSLSFGQKKRVAIAGILVMSPEVLILDEPTAGLDPQGVSEMMMLIESLKREREVAVVIATHDMDLVPLYCDYGYVLGGGKVIKEGTPEELFGEPEVLRAVHLRLPRISHLMEILINKDELPLENHPHTIATARAVIKKLWDSMKNS